MADFTKNAIQKSFLKLLNEKPLKQITVRDIVEDCGINRNTFYYHFQDIPNLIENILLEDSRQLLAENKDLETIEDCLNAVIAFILDHSREVLHTYKSANRDYFEQYQWKICEHLVSAFLDRKLENVKISEEDRTIIATYIKSLVYGVAMGWLAAGLKGDIHKFVHRICELKQGDLDALIEKCRLP